MKFMKKTSLLLAIVLSVTSMSTFSNGILAKADENVNVINSVVDSDGGLNYTQGTLQNTKYGEVKGHEENEGKTLIWSGIPYAKAPIGELRWKAPVNTEKWTGTFDATKAGNIGIQLSSGKVIGSEDCLNLDIYRPNTNEKKLPVIFYVHGGNNQTGSSGGETNFEKLSVNANCVVVAVNYRLGALGFNSLPALKTGDKNEDSGNYALLDMSKSLDWINENITAFGGNPKNITASGFSAGGRDVMAMLISPIFKGKFQKAISFSGGMTTADPEDSAKVIAKAIAPLVVKDNIKATEDEAYNWLLTDGKDVKDYLYGLSADRLASLMGNAGIRMSAFPHLYTDGTVIPKEGFNTKEYNSVPLIMSTGSTEFSLFARYDNKFAAVDDNTLLTNSELNKELRFSINYGSKLYELFNSEESAERMNANYKARIYDCDFEFGNNKDVVGEKMAQLAGAFHGLWIPFVTGETTGFSALYKDSFNNAGAQDLGVKFTKYITQFIWYGNPNSPELVAWKPWNSTSGAPTQLVLDADKDKANIKMSNERINYNDVIKEMEADTTVSKETKDDLIKNVLNGRWFSGKLDEHFNNQSLWIK
ncbi:carboxylesterase family protein [Clostridium sp. BL-8]|uniref:carboxylesterase family protein n=1 Tax=Clostridium sp. BL-8 TaxID=349938 RepID=UPI0009CD0E6D|nr:carboxylesterase family protein [Clostridium sp. BL-8]OOM77352.1 para-nitrobenzyl esterase [Clostridium sp. BL-8]